MTRGARALGWVGLVPIAALAASCLVTSDAELVDPVRTQPVLLADTAIPDPREILVVESGTEKVSFSALVRSDEDLEQRIQVRILTDYGTPGVANEPYLNSRGGTPIPPATSDAEDRIATADWFPQQVGLTGCHTVTLMVSHAFDELISGCPVDRADSSHLTWFVFVCAEGQPCPPPVDDPRIDCPEPTTRCPESTVDDGATTP